MSGPGAGLIPAVVADRLRRLRRESGLNREALARETGLSWRGIVHHELGNVPGGCWKTFGFKYKTIEWWRPLPPPPEE